MQLVLCIDRDDDLGVKAGVSSPVVGRESNLEAATRLALADPEDSDLNTIFGGVKVYDELRGRGEEVEIVSIAGDKNVGVASDQKISRQLDSLMERFKPEGVFVVTDGAEDEALLPIIRSRVKVNGVQRVVVRQSENLESTYYIIKKAFNDPKISHTIFTPLGLAFLIYAISVYLEYTNGAVMGITAAIGGYLLIRGTGLDEAFNEFKRGMGRSLHSGKVAFVMYIAAIFLSLIGTIQGLGKVLEFYGLAISQGYLVLLMAFLYASIWWYVAAGLSLSIGGLVDARFEGKDIRGGFSYPLFIVASGLLIWGGSSYILSSFSSLEVSLLGGGFRFLAVVLLGSLVISLLGAWISSHYTGRDDIQF